MTLRWLTFLCAPLSAIAVVAAQAGGLSSHAVVRYVANAGMLVSVDGRDFLIDAPIRDGIAPYPTSAPDERRRLEAAIAPRQIVAMHMPVSERAALAQALARTDLKVASPGTPGQLVTLAP